MAWAEHMNNSVLPLFEQSKTSCTVQSTHLLLGLLLLLLGLGRGQLEGFRLAVVTRPNLFPDTRSTLEVTERLGKLQGFGDNALLLLVVANLSVSGQREVLAQRVALETVVRHDASQVGVAGEEDTEQVVDLALVPVGAVKEAGDARHWGRLVGVGLNADARVVAD